MRGILVSIAGIAVKVLPAETAANPQVRERFEREARAASALNHPNILSVFDVGREGSSDYLITELVDGVTLRDRIGGDALSAREVIRIGAQIADGLSAAHAAALVHRDLKPEERDGHARRPRQDPRLRPGQADGAHAGQSGTRARRSPRRASSSARSATSLPSRSAVSLRRHCPIFSLGLSSFER